MYDSRTIELLESATPACSHCEGRTHFIIGCGYRFLQCGVCRQVDPAPAELTQAIIDAYHISPEKITTQKRPRLLFL
jgi:hypothetical protein